MSKPILDTTLERDDVYRKIKDAFDYVASIVIDEEVSPVHRIRAAKALSDLAKTLRVYIRDEERIDELEKRIKEIEKRVGF
ncbi:hypothetical protein KAS14_07500 [Candidatus Bathyarchaeota archaeon]|nr:hypothetical protein [Candidatus Bathyarchaeota archaeon]